MQLTYRGRGLCHLSYQRVLRAGGLADYAPVKRGYAVLWEDWCELEEQGYTRARAAERLGITHRHLQRVIARYRESVPA
jgi:hypothetical protein